MQSHCRRLDPFVHRGEVPRNRAASGNSGDSDAPGINLRPRLDVIHGPHPIPNLGSGRGIAQRQPMPHVQVMRAVMDARHFAKFERVENQTAEAVGRKPGGAVLIVELGSERVRGMTAEIKNRRQRFGGIFRHVKISRDVKPRQTLKNHLLDAVRFALEHARDFRFERTADWQRTQAEHLEQLTAQLRSLFPPVVQRPDVAQTTRGHIGGDALQMIGRHLMALNRRVLGEGTQHSE